jgi:hypothetical protein
MHEALLDRIADLERANGRWKWTSAILAAALFSMTISGVIFGVYGLSSHARMQAEQARALEMEARAKAALAETAAAQIEAARKRGELGLQPINPKKD